MYVELNSDQPQDISIGPLETMRSLKAVVESIKTYNERLVKVSKEDEEINEIILKNMTEMKKQWHIGQTSNNAKKEPYNEESHKRKEYQVNSDKIELLEELNSEDNLYNSTLQKFTPKTKTRKWHEEELLGEFKKIKPPNFDGQYEERAEAWILNMSKYFQIYNYPENLKARLVVYQKNGKYAIWWQEIKIVNKIRSSELN